MSWIEELTSGPMYHETNPQWTAERRGAEGKRAREDDERRRKEASERLAAMMRAKAR
jgi:hypothetical protein